VASLRGLNPNLLPIAEMVMRTLEPYGFVVTSGVRSYAEQARLYDEYRAASGSPRPAGERLYTVLPPGRSQHERGFAWDMARLNIDPKTDELLHVIGEWWRSLGGVWGGAADPVHFEAPKAWTGRS
jgi:hypothetical protein